MFVIANADKLNQLVMCYNDNTTLFLTECSADAIRFKTYVDAKKYILEINNAQEILLDVNDKEVSVSGFKIMKEVFVEAKQDEFDFSEALKLMKHGYKVCRSGWNGKGMWIELQRPDKNSKMTLPYIYMSTVTKDLVPWLASQTDILAEDWIIAYEK